MRVNVLSKNTTQCPRPGLELGPLDPKTSALTMRLTRLPRRVRLDYDSVFPVQHKTCQESKHRLSYAELVEF